MRHSATHILDLIFKWCFKYLVLIVLLEHAHVIQLARGCLELALVDLDVAEVQIVVLLEAAVVNVICCVV